MFTFAGDVAIISSNDMMVTRSKPLIVMTGNALSAAWISRALRFTTLTVINLTMLFLISLLSVFVVIVLMKPSCCVLNLLL